MENSFHDLQLQEGASMTDHDNTAFWVFITLCLVVALSLFASAPAFVVGDYLTQAGALLKELGENMTGPLRGWVPPS
jgi:hypothetical protein